jgi:hypothetical protein
MPKTYKNLYPRVCEFETLYQAHRQARQGGKRKRPEVAEFEYSLSATSSTCRRVTQRRPALSLAAHVPGVA